MPAFNVEAYIAECLDSILQQSYSDWELLITDDQSTDKTLDILQTYANRDERIKPMPSLGPKGIIPALRQAYRRSSGDYITRMDADDKMAPDKLRSLLQEVSKPDVDIATGLVDYFSTGKDMGSGYLKYSQWLNQLSKTNTHWHDIYKECVLPSPCWMISRSKLEAVGAFQPNTYPEDYDLCFRFYEANYRVSGVDEVLHFWRDHGDRASRNDPNYADVAFFPLKVNYFLKLDRDPNRPLILWGAGKKGKTVAKFLQKAGSTFRWVSNNPNKVGHDIYGVILEDLNMDTWNNAQVISVVSQPGAAQDIRQWAKQKNLKLNRDVVFFVG